MANLMRWNDRPAPLLRDAVDRLLEDAFIPTFGDGGVGSVGVQANVWETNEGYQIALLLPGVDPRAVDLSAAGNTITVAGKLEVSQPEGGRVVWQEFGQTQFRRQIGLPMDVDSNRIEAAYQNGVLLLTAPKAEHAKRRTIKIQTK
jgi:HSP20 family protein